MRFDIRHKDDIAVVRPLDAAITAFGLTEFKQQVSQLAEGGTRQMVIDLSNAEHIDSSGLATIVYARSALGDGGTLALCGLHDNVHKLVRLTRLDKVIGVYETADDAIDALLGAR
jgi:anti-sigma B factor antagonist